MGRFFIGNNRRVWFCGFSVYLKHFLGWRGSEVFEWFLNQVAENDFFFFFPRMLSPSFYRREASWKTLPLMLTNHRKAVEVPSHGRPYFCVGSLLREKMRV